MRFTKKDSRDIARKVQNKSIFTVIVVGSFSNKNYKYKVVGDSKVRDNIKEDDLYQIKITSKEFKKENPRLYTQKLTLDELEEQFYRMINKEMQRLEYERKTLVVTKYYFPVTVTKWDDFQDGNIKITSTNSLKYKRKLKRYIEEYRESEGGKGLMVYYRGNETIKEKVKYYHFNVKEVRGHLVGEVEIRSFGQLTKEEYKELFKDIQGQASDGWGSSLEEYLSGNKGDGLNIRLYTGEDWGLYTKEGIVRKLKVR